MTNSASYWRLQPLKRVEPSVEVQDIALKKIAHVTMATYKTIKEVSEPLITKLEDEDLVEIDPDIFIRRISMRRYE